MINSTSYLPTVLGNVPNLTPYNHGYIHLSSDQLLRSDVIGRLTLNTEPYSGLAAAPG